MLSKSELRKCSLFRLFRPRIATSLSLFLIYTSQKERSYVQLK